MQLLSFKPAMHIFICTNDRSRTADTRPSCGPTITPEMVTEIKLWIRSLGLTNQIYCTKASCLGFCNPEGGVLCIWPQGIFVKGVVSLEEIKDIIQQEAEKMGLL